MFLPLRGGEDSKELGRDVAFDGAREGHPEEELEGLMGADHRRQFSHHHQK